LALRLETRQGIPRVYVGLEADRLQWDPSALSGVPAAPLSLQDVRLGRILRQDGGFRTGRGEGIELFFSGTRLGVDIPEQAMGLQLQADSTSSLSASGRVTLGSVTPDLTSWFLSPDGPDFGTPREPFRLTLENLTLGQLTSLAGAPAPELEARVTGRVGLEGQWHRDHQLLASQTLRYRFELDQLELSRRVNGRRVRLKQSAPSVLSYQRQGDYGWLRADTSRWEVEETSAALPLSQPPLVSGALTGPPPLAPEVGEVEFSADLPVAGPPGWGGGPGRPLQGWASLPEGQLRLSVRRLPLSALALWFPAARYLYGTVEVLDASVSGPIPTPDLNVSFSVDERDPNPDLQVVAEGQVTGREGEDGVYRVSFQRDDRPGITLAIKSGTAVLQRASISGQIPFLWAADAVAETDRLDWFWRHLRLVSAGDMKVVARIDDSDMRLLDALVPGITQASGRLQGSVQVAGTLERPRVEGELAVENGQLRSSWFEGLVSGLNIATRFEEIRPEEAEQLPGAEPYAGMLRSRYSIEKFEGLLGGQPFSVQGKAELAGLEPTYVNVRVDGQGLPIQTRRFNGSTDVALTLDVRRGRTRENPEGALIPVLTGSLKVPKGDLFLDLSDAEATASLPSLPLRYDVDLDMGDDFWIHLGDSTVRAQGQLKLLPESETRKPVLSGALYLSRGVLRVPFYSVSFNLRQGYAYFDRSLLPVLENVEADTVVGGYQITARFDGAYPNLNVELFSNPPLAQSQLLRLMAVSGLPAGPGDLASTNIPVDNFLQTQGVAVLSGFLANPITQELGRVLFLSEVSFDYQLPATYVVKLAKALDSQDRLLLTLTRIFYADGRKNENLYGVEWRFQPNLLVRVGLDDLGQLR
ncbi:MAG: translocation/assembly module TamB domain-containing protein, partial [Candidatus Eremiobacterota bacterium]